MSVAGREQGWLGPGFHDGFREVLARAAASYYTAAPVYCLMPDHLHVLSAGVAPQADARLWARAVRRRINAMLLPCALQKQGYDHVLRPSECGRDGFATWVAYICENPVRARLAENARAWRFTGACVPGFPELDPRADEFFTIWWEYWNAMGTL